MRAWRISNHADLSGRGGLIAEGRWNQLGVPVVYCSDHPATALLELLAHVDREDVPTRFRLLTINLPDEAPSLWLNHEDLPTNWREEPQTTRKIGSDLLRANEHLWITVPSVLVPEASNILLNPRHLDAARCQVVDIRENALDLRLVR